MLPTSAEIETSYQNIRNQLGGRAAAGNIDDARYFATATLLPNGKVLIVGGYRMGIVSTSSAWIYQS